jgi:hypothetical protein
VKKYSFKYLQLIEYNLNLVLLAKNVYTYILLINFEYPCVKSFFST